jgi:hypothetical protein
MDWEKLPAGRWGLRQLGVLLLFVAYVVSKHLLAIGSANHGDQPPIVYFLAMIAFLCGSAGSALLVHGHHLFDKIQVSERWQRRAPAAPPDEQAADAEAEIGEPFYDSQEPALVPENPRTVRIL